MPDGDEREKVTSSSSRRGRTDEPDTCPKCGADDDNPSFEVLPYCWRCGHVDDAMHDDAKLDDRRKRAHVRRLGVPADLIG